METIKSVGIKNLKNSLSAYLREVQNGVRIFITDREKVVAELRRPILRGELSESSVLLESWVVSGRIKLGGVKQELPKSYLKFPDGTAKKLLDKERGD